jgi:phosphohistidine phosphatase
MKRELILIRHTKSSWNDFSMPDFDRPIKKERAEDAKEMAAKLKSLKLEPDLIICSPAKRTRQTAEYFYEKLKYEEDRVQFEKRIYESSAGEIFEVVREVKPEVKTLVLIGHNPSLTNFANFFTKEPIDEIPTTGVVWLEFDSKDWEIDRQTPCKVKHFLTPKSL